MYEKELEQLGLSEKEAKVYLASLELGPETAQNIAQKTGINRATTYVQIESLKKRGLMSEVEQGKKTLYVPESPERLHSLLRTFEAEIELKRSDVERILPSLLGMFAGMGERPKVRFFEGVEGADAMRDDFLKTPNKMIEGFVNLDKLFGVFPKHESEYTQKRVLKGIKSRVIYTRKDGPLDNANSEKMLREAHFVSGDQLPLTSDMTIYGDKIALATYGVKPIGVIIESKDIAQTFRAIFYVLWKTIDV